LLTNTAIDVIEKWYKKIGCDSKGMLSRRPRKTIGYVTPAEVFFGRKVGVKIALQS